MEMAGLVERVESQRRASHSFHEPLGNLAKSRRDSHIPTAPATVPNLRRNSTGIGKCGPWKSGNPKPGFPLFHRPGKPAAARKATSTEGNRAVFDGQAGAGFPSDYGALRASNGAKTNRLTSGEQTAF